MRDATKRSTSLSAVAAVLLLSAAASASAQWQEVLSTRAVTEREAVVISGNQQELRIWLDDKNTLRMQFKLAPGLIPLAPQTCLTIQVDNDAMQHLSSSRYQCETNGASATLLLGQLDNKRLNSSILVDLINGKEVTLRYRLEHAGYGAAQFSLKGSKQALRAALGGTVSIVSE